MKIYSFLQRRRAMNFKYNVLELCVVSVIWSVWVHGSFMGFNLWIGPSVIFEPSS